MILEPALFIQCSWQFKEKLPNFFKIVFEKLTSSQLHRYFETIILGKRSVESGSVLEEAQFSTGVCRPYPSFRTIIPSHYFWRPSSHIWRGATHFFCLFLDLSSLVSSSKYFSTIAPFSWWRPFRHLGRGATTFLLPFPRLYLPCLFQQIFFPYCPFSFHVLPSHIRVTPLP